MDQTTDEVISSVVRAESARNRLTQADMAVVLGVSRGALNDRMCGRTHWAARELPPLSEALGVSIADLIGGDQ